MNNRVYYLFELVGSLIIIYGLYIMFGLGPALILLGVFIALEGFIKQRE